MTHIPDLTQCFYVSESDRIIAVGWLDSPHDFARGDVAPGDFDVIVRLLNGPCEPSHFMDYHECSLCDDPQTPVILVHKGVKLFLGARNLWIPAHGRIYVAPSLILHYIADHGYLPPEEFLSAARKCRQPGSAAYLDLMQRWGPRWVS